MLPLRVLYYGKDEPLPETRELRAGPLTVLLEPDGIRYVRLGSIEILRRIYVAVRDREWNTLPAVFSNPEITNAPDSFEVRLDARCREGEIDFAWRTTIIGGKDGSITFRMDGEARSTFLTNRVGLCVLYPIRECATKRCQVEHPDGSVEDCIFPEYVAPNPVFRNIASLRNPVASGLSAEVRFTGNVFEMEDQRNWIDASFKVYSPPLERTHPVEFAAGQRISQSVVLKLEGRVPHLRPAPTDLTLRIGEKSTGAPFLPCIGLSMPESLADLTSRQSDRLKALRLDHLRVDLDLRTPGWRPRLENAVKAADRIKTRILVAFNPAENAILEELANTLESSGARVSSFVVLDPATPEEANIPWSRFTNTNRKFGTDGIRPAMGTAGYFVELNPSWLPKLIPPPTLYSANPQVHASDHRTLVENLAGLAETLVGGRARAVGGYVSPLTLRPRSRPFASISAAGELPPEVDERQMSLFGAGWTVGSLKHLSEHRAGIVTYYETVGWRGVMESDAGSPLPRKFQSIAGSVFPLYHVLADMADLQGDIHGDWMWGRAIPSLSSDPLSAEILAIAKDDRIRILATNFTPEARKAVFVNVPGRVRIRRLNETNAERAMVNPEEYRSEGKPVVESRDGRLELELLPFEVVTMDSV